MRLLKSICIWLCAATCLFGNTTVPHGVEYFDLGAWQSWNFMDWSKGEVDKSSLDTYIDSFSAQLIDQSLSKVMLSFAQVADITNMYNENYADLSATNAIGMLNKNTGGKQVDGHFMIQYIVMRFTSHGIAVGISFGGASAQDKDWDFDFDNNDPADLAVKLSEWAGSVGFGMIDFDVESAAFSKNDPHQLYLFFNGLFNSYKGEDITLTVMGDVNTWGVNGPIFGDLFKGKPLQTMFTGLNLMLYNGQYYLNAGQTPTQSWDLFVWMTQLKDNMKASYGDVAKYVSIGLNSKIDYTSEKSSGGPLPYTSLPANISSGEAAAFIYKDLIKSLGTLSGEEIALVTPFFWDDNADYTVSSANKYESQFFVSTDNFEKDFYKIFPDE